MAEEFAQDQSEEIKVDELDEKELEDASGGLASLPTEDTTNNGCNCSCG